MFGEHLPRPLALRAGNGVRDLLEHHLRREWAMVGGLWTNRCYGLRNLNIALCTERQVKMSLCSRL